MGVVTSDSNEKLERDSELKSGRLNNEKNKFIRIKTVVAVGCCRRRSKSCRRWSILSEAGVSGFVFHIHLSVLTLHVVATVTCLKVTQSHSPLLPTCFISSMEPASYITQDSSSKLFIPLSATIIRTCRFNLLHTAITFHHFFTVSL